MQRKKNQNNTLTLNVAFIVVSTFKDNHWVPKETFATHIIGFEDTPQIDDLSMGSLNVVESIDRVCFMVLLTQNGVFSSLLIQPNIYKCLICIFDSNVQCSFYCWIKCKSLCNVRKEIFIHIIFCFLMCINNCFFIPLKHQ